MELRFTVWQFVRLMVHLEERAEDHALDADLLSAWADIWTPLDQELAQLAERDFEAYGELMMDQDVVIEDAGHTQIQAAHAALMRVVTEMDAAIERGGEPAHLQNLKFERRELRQLARKLDRLNAKDS